MIKELDFCVKRNTTGNNWKRLLRGVMVAALMMVLPQVVSADEMGYFIRSYHVDATVHTNNVYDVTETIDLTFTEPRHGFYRYVPTEYYAAHKVTENGKKGVLKNFRYVCSVKNMSADGWDYTDCSNSSNEGIRIGNADETVIGEQRYIIHYTLVYPDDRYDGYDMINHTLLPTDCNVPIKHFSFRMKFEKELPVDVADNLKVYYGTYGEKAVEMGKVIVDVKDHLITGSADGIEPLHTVSLYCQIEEGYYEGAKSTSSVPCILMFGVSLLLVLIIIYYEITTKHPHVVKSIEFYPPEGISSAEVGTIIDESADDVDIASLIPWLADKGFIAIEEFPDEKGRLGSHAKLKLTKTHELPKDAPDYQKKLMKLLFDKKQTILMDDIGEKPKEYAKLKVALQNTFKGDRKLTHTSGKIWLIALLFLTSTIMFWVSSPVTYSDTTAALFALVGWLMPMVTGFTIRAIEHQRSFLSTKMSRFTLFAIRLLVMLCVCCVYYFVVSEDCEYLPNYLGAVMFIAAFIVCELSSRFTINTEYRAKLIGRLKGFKEFIETAEKPQLATLQESDPKYFYRVLPYAMVFGISDKWANLFKDINVEKPDWYSSNNVNSLTNAMFINNMVHNLNSTTTHNIQMISHDSSASSSGGGGFAGGGGGGGGCGSW